MRAASAHATLAARCESICCSFPCAFREWQRDFSAVLYVRVLGSRPLHFSHDRWTINYRELPNPFALSSPTNRRNARCKRVKNGCRAHRWIESFIAHGHCCMIRAGYSQTERGSFARFRARFQRSRFFYFGHVSLITSEWKYPVSRLASPLLAAKTQRKLTGCTNGDGRAIPMKYRRARQSCVAACRVQRTGGNSRIN